MFEEEASFGGGICSKFACLREGKEIRLKYFKKQG